MDTMIKKCSSVFLTLLTLTILTSFPIVTFADDDGPIDEVVVRGERPKMRDIKDSGGRRGVTPIGNDGGGNSDSGGAAAKETKRRICAQKRKIIVAVRDTCIANRLTQFASDLASCPQVRVGGSGGFRGGAFGIEFQYESSCKEVKTAQRDANVAVCNAEYSTGDALITECY
jgi:hypothetical protein